MDHAETTAKTLIETMFRGSRMDYRVDQSHSNYDFDWHHPDGRISAMEVTSSVDARNENTLAAIRNPRKGGSVIIGTHCKHAWYIRPLPTGNINAIRQRVDRLLAEVERAGYDHLFCPSDLFSSDAIKSICESGIDFGSVVTWGDPGSIRIGPPSTGNAVCVDDLLGAVRTEAYKADNRRKLNAATMEERHLFVYVDPSNVLPWCGLVDFSPPFTLPDIPPEITHVWVSSEGRAKNSYKIWCASKSSAWQTLKDVSFPEATDQ